MIGLLTIVAIGFLLGMRHATDPDHVMAVGVMLIVLGVRNLGGAFTWSSDRLRLHEGPPPDLPRYHSHGDYVHLHHHAHKHGHPHDPGNNPVAAMDRWLNRSSAYQLVRPLIVGIIHGLAGSAAIALLVLSTI